MRAIVTFSFVLAFALISVQSCTSSSSESNEETLDTNALITRGHALVSSQCVSCHSPRGNHENRVAPPFFAIKKHYMDSETSLQDFKHSIVAFVSSPSTERSKMPGAVERFGLMPNMGYSREDLESIAAYLYLADMDTPDWFESHYAEHHGPTTDTQQTISPLEQGKQLALSTKAVLGKNLMGTIQRSGTDAALSFCNERAYPLTDSMAQQLGARIKRVSDKNRNPNNAASADELAYIASSKALMAGGQEIKPLIKQTDNGHTGYYPIYTNQMCLQCHGTPETDIASSTAELIEKLYPNDKATGYGINQLRGIWVVDIPK